MFSCNCLNVLIHTKSNDIQKIDVDNLQLSEDEKKDPFFNKEVLGVVAESITKQQTGLVLTRQVGLWAVQSCINCSLDTHAVHKDKGASCVLVASNLLNGTTNISSLRNSDNFSSAFGILIKTNVSDDIIEPKIAGYQILASVSQLPEGLQVAVNSLQQQLTQVLRLEVAATEERVRRYTDLQYANLENFREQVHTQHNTLLRLVLNNHLSEVKLNSMEPAVKSPTYPRAVNEPETRRANDIESSPRQAITKPKHPIVTNLVSKSKRSVSRQLSQPLNKEDSEDGILFPMDGMEESPTLTHSDVEESDTDDSASHDEGIHIPRQRTHSISIAKSLPMNIPVFMSAFPHEAADDRELKCKEDLDIAASIKALAKSVHGDDVFGDLPRPRFSTQI